MMKASRLIKAIQWAMIESESDFNVVCRVKSYNKEGDFVDGVKPNDTINVYLDSKSRPYGVIELIKTNNIDEVQE